MQKKAGIPWFKNSDTAHGFRTDPEILGVFWWNFAGKYCKRWYFIVWFMGATGAGISLAVVHPRSFRHRFAKNFIEKYNDIALLADLMGHESIETTRIYLRMTASEQQKIVDKVVIW